MGVRRPFRPGGMTMNDMEEYESMSLVQEEDSTREGVEQFLSEEAVTRAREGLIKSSKLGWEDGTLITAPPGVSFDVGLSYEDVFVVEDGEVVTRRGGDGGSESNGMVDDAEGGGGAVGGGPESLTLPGKAHFATSVPASTMFDKSYFDDDSLFGESSVGSSSDEDDDEGSLENSAGDESVARRQVVDVTNEKMASLSLNDSSTVDEVDLLLSEINDTLQSPIDQSRKSMESAAPVIHPPINVEKSNTDNNKSPSVRKSWAVTEYIPITTNSDFHTLLPNPALTFPFELDDFQKQAVLRLERSECVFLAAHTSAGKTVCAEYAIALAMKHCTRAIYTSPIKALSNQKYRDFRNKFGDDVGLITGDMQIGADGSCLVMTTEILRSMLYRGADLIRDIEWVIFDEVHYINDSERGVVWEEVIIMLPDYVNLIFLSATTPNTIEFSEWIGRTKRKPVHVIRTNYRPVPLSHNLWAGLKLHKLMEGREGFNPKGYAEAAKALLPLSVRAAQDDKAKGVKGKAAPPTIKPSSKPGSQQGSKQDWLSLARYLEREGLMPTIYCVQKCEEIANMLRSLDLNTAAERSLVQSFTIQTVARLSPVDSNLPQVIATCEMVKRGIGVHHGGLLPILKEMVEILFSRNLIKILFATETFAMGVNMPARSVVFNSIRKHDGVQFRELQPGEYTQMAGRAGRRGLDKVGTVIICCFGSVPPDQVVLRNMLTGSSTKLQSQFRLTYTMILNLLRVEDMSVEGMIKRSFSEFATQRALTTNDYPKLLTRGTKTLSKLDEEFKSDSDSRIGAEDIEEYYFACKDVLSWNNNLISYLLSSGGTGGAGGTGGGALVTGRILLVTSSRKQHGYVRAPAIVLRAPLASTSKSGATSPGTTVICMVLLPEGFTLSDDDSQSRDLKLGDLNYVGKSYDRNFVIHEIEVSHIFLVSSLKAKIDSKVFFQESSKKGPGLSLSSPFAGAKSIKSRQDDDPFAGMVARGKKAPVQSKPTGLSQEAQLVDEAMSHLIKTEAVEKNTGVELLDLRDCAKNMHQGNQEMEFRHSFDALERATALAREFQSHYHPNLEKHYTTVDRKETLRSRVMALRHLLSNESLQLFPDYLQRKSLLQKLGYIDENDTVCLKGRVACEVNTCESLIVTEMVFEGMLSELEPTEIVALLSALLFQEKSDEELDSELPQRLVSSCERMRGIAVYLGEKQKECGLPVDPLEYAATSLKMGLIHVVYEWACGVPFSSICELTDVQEGSIVRCITRLDELCREVRNCARVVGNPTLYRKMEAASEAIKRDIVFASSLYVA
ncbi:hypothetical protein HJC23_008022 [Cyclotella cryptica]|uniref:Helicase SKI2W n=1 Tax=Cyclotella cryptica TaxID=29204 RepID=A0ABD3Q4H5_9STRA